MAWLDEGECAKADQLIHHFFAKTVAVISQARSGDGTSTPPPPTADPASSAAEPRSEQRRSVSGASKTRRINKWFNLELPEPEPFRSQLKTWRTISSTYLDAAETLSRTGERSPATEDRVPPALVLEVVLDSSDLTANQVVVLSDQRGRRVRVGPPAPEGTAIQGNPAAARGYNRTSSPSGYRPGLGGAGTRSPARRGAHTPPTSLPPIVLERWTLQLVPYARPDSKSQPQRQPLRKGSTGPSRSSTSSFSSDSRSAAPSRNPSPRSSSTASYALPSRTTSPAPLPAPAPSTAHLELPTVYKHSILHFRNLYSLARTLPAFALARKLGRRRKGLGTGAGGGSGGGLGVEGASPAGVARTGAGLKIGAEVRAVDVKALAEGRDEEEQRPANIDVDVPLERSVHPEATGWAPRGVGSREGDGQKTAETIDLPGVATPYGTLVLSVAYRSNTDFAFEDIETLLSSRFIDEDFFRPTVARYAERAGVPPPASSQRPPVPDEVVRPGSLPISAAFQPRDPGLVSAAPRRYPSSAAPSPPGHRSYGSLSARGQPSRPEITRAEPAVESVAPPQPQPPLTTTTDTTAPVQVPGAAASPKPRATARRYDTERLAGGTPTSDSAVAGTPSRDVAERRDAASGTTGAGDPVEPAFISLSRARRTSFGAGNGGAGGGTASGSRSRRGSSDDTGRAVPVPVTSGAEAQVPGSLPRRTSLTSSGASGSPIFRPGSYLSSSPSQGYGYNYSGAGAGIIRQQPVGGSPASQQSFTVSRSPLGGPPTFPGGESGPAPVARPIVAGGRSSSYTSTTGAGPASGSQGSYTASRSYGRPGSSGGSAEWPAGVATGATPGSESLSRRSPSSRLSFGAAGSPAVGAYAAGRSSRLGTMMRQHDKGRSASFASSSSAPAAGPSKRFLNEGKPPEDAAEIEDFLSLLDSKPDLRGLEASRSLPTASSTAGGRSVVMSKRDIDEQLRLLKSSVIGSIGTGSGESPSPPAFTSPPGAGAGGVTSGSPRAPSGLSALRRQTSRLSIEEHPAEELAAEAAAAAAAAAAARRQANASPAGDPPSRAHTPAALEGSAPGAHGAGHRSSKRDALVSPTLSATSASTALPPPPLSGTGESPLHLEPRFLPLPKSSTTSPLASPRAQMYGPFPCLAPDPAPVQPYPPLPYPPASYASAEATSCSEPISLGPYTSHASRQPVGPPPTHAGGTGGFGLSTIDSERTSIAASVSSLSTRGDGDGDPDAENSYRGEEEAVGRLELDDLPAIPSDTSSEDVRRGRTHWSGLSASAAASRAREADVEDDISTLAAAAIQHSRDPTPAARQHSTSYFAAGAGHRRRSRSRGASGGIGGGRSPPDMPWMA
ncbi:hypothetical protein JCM8202_002297 [Rhodotorula sphaerocarpa]